MNLKGAIRSVLTARAVRPVIRRLPLPKSIYQSLHFKDEISIPLHDGKGAFRTVHSGFQVENDIYWAGFGRNWEGFELRVWTQLARSSQSIFDIGSNTGIYALAAGAANPSATIWAFEPVAKIAERLRRNAKLNPFDIRVEECALSDVTGEQVFFEPPGEHAYSATLSKDMAAKVGATVERKVPVVRFEDFIRDRAIARVDLIKIDAEEHELAVLAGFGDIFTRFGPILQIEVLSQKFGAQIAQYIARFDYQFAALQRGARIGEGHLGDRASNYLLFPKSRREEIGLVLNREAN